jgi:hypothetical protein
MCVPDNGHQRSKPVGIVCHTIYTQTFSPHSEEQNVDLVHILFEM